MRTRIIIFKILPLQNISSGFPLTGSHKELDADFIINIYGLTKTIKATHIVSFIGEREKRTTNRNKCTNFLHVIS
jgi:hypothetical protein